MKGIQSNGFLPIIAQAHCKKHETGRGAGARFPLD